MGNQIQKMERTRVEEEAPSSIRRTRNSNNPLSDCTNTIDSLNPSQSSSASTKNSSSIIKPSKFQTKNTNITAIGTRPKGTKADTTTGSSGGTDDRENDHSPSNPSAIIVPSVSTPSQTKIPSSLKGAASDECYEPFSVYSRRKSKRKADAVPMSCFPAVKTKVAGNQIAEGGITSISKSCTVPHKKKRREITPKEDVAINPLPQDFIEKQRAYFAEIDAFELPEEEVASVDELD